MYLSKIVLNPVSYQVQKEIENPYQLHRTIINAFPEILKNKKREGRILFRIEKERNRPYLSVLIQSSLCPNWEFLMKKDNYLLKDPVFKQFNYPKFKIGNKYWFCLFSNPTKKVNGQRVGFYNEIDQYNWIQRKAELLGFQILYVSIIRKEEVKMRANKNSPTMTFFGVQFEGALRVTSPKLFKYALKNGIGSGKAFGFGLLTISKF